MTESQKQAIMELRDEGYAVIVWTPEELEGVSPEDIEDASISYVWTYLIPSKPYPIED